jgi:hypothetical protein
VAGVATPDYKKKIDGRDFNTEFSGYRRKKDQQHMSIVGKFEGKKKKRGTIRGKPIVQCMHDYLHVLGLFSFLVFLPPIGFGDGREFDGEWI